MLYIGMRGNWVKWFDYWRKYKKEDGQVVKVQKEDWQVVRVQETLT